MTRPAEPSAPRASGPVGSSVPVGSSWGPAPRASTARLQRLLALVPYVTSRKVASVEETAAAFGLSERQLVDDLNMLWCVELRAPDPYCPIDLSYEGGEIVVSQADPVGRPLRLGADEASALLVALRMLADMQEHSSAVRRVIAKLEVASGEAAALSSQVAVQVDSPGPAVLARAREALAAGRRVHLTYYVSGRDEATERDVDPMRLIVVDGRTYLEGWCRRAEGVRLFRIDRVVAIEVLPAAAEVPAGAEAKDIDQGLYQPAPDDLRVVFELSPEGRWVADDYPCESVEELGDGRLRAVLRTADPRWVSRLALRLGERGRLVEPVSLADDVRALAASALAQYELA
jgi:proteasome accessory factor C